MPSKPTVTNNDPDNPITILKCVTTLRTFSKNATFLNPKTSSSLFLNTNFTENALCFIGNRTWILRVEGNHANHLTTTTAQKCYLISTLKLRNCGCDILLLFAEMRTCDLSLRNLLYLAIVLYLSLDTLSKFVAYLQSIRNKQLI